MGTRVASVRDLVKALGGPKKAGDLLGTTPQSIVNWRSAGKMPARFYLVHKQRLYEHGYDVPDYLWNLTEPERAA